MQRSFKVWISSSSSCGLSLGPGDPLAGDPLTGDPPLPPPVLLADDCLAGEVFFNGEVYPPPLLLADEALPLGGEEVIPPPPPPPTPLLMKSENSLVSIVASPLVSILLTMAISSISEA